MKILKADYSDLKNISTLAVQVWLDTYAAEGIRTTFSDYIWEELTTKNFQHRFNNRDREYYKVVKDDHLIGFFELNYNSPYGTDKKLNLEVEKLYIQQNFCGKGIGSKIIDFINSLCSSRNICSFWLSVYENNERAIMFYKKVNFVEIGEIYFELGAEKHRNLVLKRIVI